MNAAILLGHGSRIKGSEKDMELVADALRSILRDTMVETSYLSLTMPPFEDAVSKCIKSGASDVTVIPYMLSGGAHVMKDIPEMIGIEAKKHPGVNIVCGDYLGFDDGMVECVRRRIVAARRITGASGLMELVAGQKLAVLSTQDESSNCPYTSLVGFVPIDGIKRIVFATLRETRKFKNIVAHPNVSLLIDNRNQGADVFFNAEAITVMGTANETLADDRTDCLKHFLGRHPQLEDFVNNPSCAMICIQVEKIIHVDHLLNVTEMKPE